MGWEDKKLSDVCRLINGRAYKKKEMLSEGPYPLLRVGNFFTNRTWYYSDLELDENKYCEAGDLLYAWSASFGPRIWDGDKVIYHYHIWKIELNSEVVDKTYLYHLLDWDKERIKVEQGAGTTMVHVSKGSMEKRVLPFPLIPEQKRIVAILDQAFADIDKARANAEQNLKNARELYLSKKCEIFDNVKAESEVISLPAVCETIFAGGDAPKKGMFSKTKTEKFQIPIYANAVKNNGLYGFSDYSRADKPSITIAARGSGTGHIELRREEFLPIVRLIVLIPNEEKLSLEYLKHALQNLDILRSGSAIPQLTVPMIKEYSIPVPSLDRQKTIIEELNFLGDLVEKIQNVYEGKILLLDELKKSILQKAFSGELTKNDGKGTAA